MSRRPQVLDYGFKAEEDPMTDRQPEREQLRPDAVVPREGAQSGWVGMVIFAGIVMILLGAFNVINAVGHMAFVSAHPVWSVMIIALDVLVIYALTAHGRELGQEGPVRG